MAAGAHGSRRAAQRAMTSLATTGAATAPAGVPAVDATAPAATDGACGAPTRRTPRLSDPPKLRHRNALDGIRGIAVLTVVFFHLELGWMSGGYLGVDVFFVLSGFLITTLLLREWNEHGRIDLKRFWVRRARRLLPAMLLVLGAVAIFAWFFAEPEQLDDIRTQGLASLLYVTNWARAAEQTSYFDQFAAKSPLEHYWSLAIEEQFYLVWPLVAMALFTWRAKANDALGRARRYDLPLWFLGVGGAVASAMLMLVLYSPSNTGLYFRTDTRVQGLFIGVAIAGLYDGVGRRLMAERPAWLEPAGWAAGAVFVVAAITDVTPGLLYRGGFLAIAMLTGTVIIAAMCTPRSRLDRALSVRPLRFFGRISYGLYLWHWPVILVLSQERTGLSLPTLNVLRFVLSVLLAVVSLLAMEVPIRERRMPIRLEFAGLGAVPVALAVALLITTTGAGQSLEEAYAADRRSAPPVEATAPDVEMPDEVNTLVLGDDLALALPNDWGDPDGDGPATGTATLLGTGCDDPTEVCDSWRAQWQARVAEHNPSVVMVALRNWENFDDSGIPPDFFDPAETERAYTESMDRLATDLGAGPTTDGGRTVVFVTIPVREDPDATKLWTIERTREAATKVAARRNGAVAHQAIEALWCGPVPCIDQARLTPDQPSLNLISPNPAALGTALAGVARNAVREHLTVEASADRLRVLLLGDSVAWSIGSNFYGTGSANDADHPIMLWNQAEFQCFPDPAPGKRIGLPGETSTECPDWADRWAPYLTDFDPQIVLLPVSQWMIQDRVVDGRTIAFDSPEMRKRITMLYGQMIDELSVTGALVVLTTVIPNVGSVRGFNANDLSEAQRREVELNKIIGELVEQRPEQADLIDLAGWLCTGTTCEEELDGVRLRPDGGHFTAQSSPLAGAFLTDELERIAKERGLDGGSQPDAPADEPDQVASATSGG
ncbi:MAG: acyltransferase [Microthrixaceae bacterium]